MMRLYDPCCKERAVSVVEPGLIQGVKMADNGHDVRVELLLTSGWCPFSTHLLQMIDQHVRAIEGVEGGRGRPRPFRMRTTPSPLNSRF